MRLRLLVYALGGGLGHLQRSLALGRAAVARGHGVEILSNSPAWPRVAGRAVLEGIEVRHLVGDPSSVLAQARRRVTVPDDHDILIVDTLPRGIGGELDDLLGRAGRVPSVFVHRDLDPRYAQRSEVRRAAARYNLVLCPGEAGPLGERLGATRTAPWLLLDAGELLAPSTARTELGRTDDPQRRLVVIADSTEPGEARGLAALARSWAARLGDQVTIHRARLERTWPLLRYHLGIDLLVGGGGYNTVMEARATGTPFCGIARQRLYDRQDRRLLRTELLEDVPAVQPRVIDPHLEYENGAHAAVRRIEELA